MTKVFEMKNNLVNKEGIKECARLIREGEVVAFPTETVYGLGADALNPEALKKIFKAKNRPADNPLIVHVSDVKEVEKLAVEINEKAKILMKEFWPGPLTILFKKKEIVPEMATAGLETVGVRLPANEIARELIKEAKTPIAAPSANTSTKPSPTDAKHVIEDLKGKIAAIIDGGQTGVGLESTVVDMTGENPVILRPGGVTIEMIEKVLPGVEYDPALKDSKMTPKSPGQKYKHYSPKAKVILFYGENEKVFEEIKRTRDKLVSEGKKVGIMATDETKNFYEGEVISLGSKQNLEEIAKNLFYTLREFDYRGVDVILSETFDEIGIGKAVMNRLKKSAGGDFIVLK